MPTSNAGISLPEVARMIEALRGDTTERFDRLDRKFDSLDATYVRRETYVSDRKGSDVYIAGMETRIAKLENTLQWVLKTIRRRVHGRRIGAFFAASKWI
jgi:sugar-specific transcriptional regulator TrmB